MLISRHRGSARRVLLRRAVTSALLVLTIPISVVLADIRDPWWSNTEDPYLYTGESVFTTGDAIRTRITNMDWTSSGATNMRHNATHGYRFTVDVQHDPNFGDGSPHVSATWRWTTNLPNPHFDRDLAASRCIEAEVTSESSTFPSDTSLYYVNFWWSHWFYSSPTWIFDPNDGYMYYSEQLSQQLAFVSDKWNTVSGETAFVGRLWYPERAQGSGVPDSNDYPCQYDGADTGGALSVEAEPAEASLAGGYAEVPTEQPERVRLVPDLSRGVGEYAHRTRALAVALVEKGRARGILTFSRPLSATELENLEQPGLEIIAIEAVSDADDGGARMTFGDAYHPDVWSVMDGLATEENVEMLGVVSAQVVVEDVKTLNALHRHPDVYAVDLSMEQVLRSRPDVEGVLLNDLYWYLAGWEHPPADEGTSEGGS